MPNPMGERNLLVGILAWQKKFISAEALVTAMSAWTRARDKGLTQILREQNALTENQHALLEEAVYDQLAKHDNDAKTCLAALKSVEPIKQELAKIADADLQASVAHVAIGVEPIVLAEVIEAEAAPIAKAVPAKPAKGVPKNRTAPQPPAKTQAGGIPTWAWLTGGVIGGGFVVLFAMVSIVLAVIFVRDEKPGAQAKPDVASVQGDEKVDKGGAKPAPSKDLDKGGKPLDPPIEPGAPLVDRKPTEVVGAAEWRAEGDELVVNNPTLKRAYLYFGSKAWTDYDFSFEANSAARSSGTLALFRASDPANHYGFSLGAYLRTKHSLSRVEKGVLTYDVPDLVEPFKLDRWYAVRIEARGDHVRCFVDGREIFDYKNDAHAHGQVAFGATPEAQACWKNIRVTAPNGQVLWAGPPELAATKPTPPPSTFVALFNGKDLTGWEPHPKRPGNWRVENGILIGSAPLGGGLYSTRGNYQDFRLRAEVRMNDKGFGRILGRAAYDPTKIPFRVLGYAAVINQRPFGNKTGTLVASSLTNTSAAQAKESPVPAGEWFLLELAAMGDLVTVKINGAAVAEFRDERRQFARSGHIALHQDANAPIEFRKIEIEDSTAKAGAAPRP